MVQTRRDQLHAYRFQNRRALAALVTGEPNVMDPPMRRLTITTLSGIMIAVLVTVGFALYGLIRPTAGDSWKDAGAVVVESGSGATYVYRDGLLHPTLNYTSAVLAAGDNAHAVQVDRDDIAGTPRGATIGIAGLPVSLPPAGDLVGFPVTACSRQRVLPGGDDLTAEVGLTFGTRVPGRTLPPTTGVVVDTGEGTTQYLLLGGLRLKVVDAQVLNALGVQARPLQVGTAFLEALPPGPDLRAPDVTGHGTTSPLTVGARHPVVGQLLHADDGSYRVVMADGVAVLDPVQTALFETLPIGSGDRPLPPLEVAKADVIGLPTSQTFGDLVDRQLQGLPTRLPTLSSDAPTVGGVCAVYGADKDRPQLSVPPSVLPSYRPAGITQTGTSERGLADVVTVPGGRAALVRSADGAATTFLVADSGSKYAFASDDVLGALGYARDDAAAVPAQVLALVPTGPAMSPTAALTPVGR